MGSEMCIRDRRPANGEIAYRWRVGDQNEDTIEAGVIDHLPFHVHDPHPIIISHERYDIPKETGTGPLGRLHFGRRPANDTRFLRLPGAMAVGYTSTRHAADEEARAEVDVLNSRLEKTTQLTKKIQASLGRLEATGKSVREVVGPLNGETKRLQTLTHSTSFSSPLETRSALSLAPFHSDANSTPRQQDVDAVIGAIERLSLIHI